MLTPTAPAASPPVICPDCGEPMNEGAELLGRDHYLCAECADQFHREQAEFAELLNAEVAA